LRIVSEVLPLEWRQVNFDERLSPEQTVAGTVRLDPGTTKNGEGRGCAPRLCGAARPGISSPDAVSPRGIDNHSDPPARQRASPDRALDGCEHGKGRLLGRELTDGRRHRGKPEVDVRAFDSHRHELGDRDRLAVRAPMFEPEVVQQDRFGSRLGVLAAGADLDHNGGVAPGVVT
jgi:hypothetical protein